ncbi:ImmA/IrrE family metallo-endopeptidase [Oscillibacter ruminantium]|uniref:ImmA/IrrE family metallo-endopeptidase n=1 Tax=Oscillibacter ruminantium TaxID=1263547 RepID=UPI0006841A83|nr:ImmA/IrrE family metallo-endopeptidase [Oscillibacter ruminantium]
MGNNLVSLYEYAESKKIDVDWFSMQESPSLSVLLPDGSCAIAIDPWKMDGIAMETECMAHELGHCERGAFYNKYATCDIVQMHENKADKWAIQRLIPPDELDEAIADGCDTYYALAERFGVTEDFARKAVCLHVYGNLDCKDYLPM